jgi:hypothetical protein
MTKVAFILGLFISSVEGYALVLTKKVGLATFWVFFSKPHLVALPSIYTPTLPSH